MADAGWYPDPQDPNAEQYWDGQAWSGQRRGAGSGSAGAYRQGYQAPGTGGQRSAGNPPAGGGKKRRNLLIAAGVVIALVAAGLVALLVLPGDDAPSITYQGKAIKNADTVLTSAESSVTKTVAARHGVKGKDSRCYFVRAEDPATGVTTSDVDSSLSCGPVLFVDGDKAQEYLPVRLSADTSAGKAVLSAQSSLDRVDPAGVRPGYQLVRPDGETPPSGNGGLAVPPPPATTKDSITTASLGPTAPPAALTRAVMVGRTQKVTVSAAGYIPRYGSGTDARSAPSGQKLLAFRASLDAGELSSASNAEVKLMIDGVAHDVPLAGAGEYVIAAVPASSATTLQLIDSGTTQSLSLPAGTPGSSNLAVLTRAHRTQVLGRSFTVPIVVRKGSQKADIDFKTTATLARLDYWPAADTSVRPSKPSDALLSVRVNYTDTTDPGGPYGFDPSLLRLELPTGTYVKARNIAPKGKIANVFEVPATFTTGTLQITGTQQAAGGVTATVRTMKQIAIRIAAG